MTEISVNSGYLSSNEKEKNKREDTILNLAQELGLPVEDVKKLYEEILETFRNATIKDFVPIFVTRSTRERLKHLQHTN